MLCVCPLFHLFITDVDYQHYLSTGIVIIIKKSSCNKQQVKFKVVVAAWKI